MEIETSNLIHWLITASPSHGMTNHQMGHGQHHNKW